MFMDFWLRTQEFWWNIEHYSIGFIKDKSDLFLITAWFLTHWGRVRHICVGKLTNIGSDNGLSPGQRQAIIWTNAGILLIWRLGPNFSEILIGIQTFSFKKMYLKISSAKWRPFCLGLNVLTWQWYWKERYNFCFFSSLDLHLAAPLYWLQNPD